MGVRWGGFWIADFGLRIGGNGDLPQRVKWELPQMTQMGRDGEKALRHREKKASRHREKKASRHQGMRHRVGEMRAHRGVRVLRDW